MSTTNGTPAARRQDRHHSALTEPRSQLPAAELHDAASSPGDAFFEDLHTPSPTRPHSHAHRTKQRPVLNTTVPASLRDGSLPPVTAPAPLRIRKAKAPSPAVPDEMRVPRILVCSLGNPAPYHTTRHSAGNILLKLLGQHMHLPTLAKNKTIPGGLVAMGADAGDPTYTLWQSGSMMNTSGTAVLKAWKAFGLLHSSPEYSTGLVILHDELESAPGTLKVRRGESSPKGHNGIKSVQASLKSAGLLGPLGDRFVKVGVGIGRPTSRDRDEVSAWVLGQLTAPEQHKIDASVASLIAILQSEVATVERS